MINLLLPYPSTRVNDLFVSDNSCIDFSPITKNFKNSIIKGSPNTDYRFQADFYQKIGIDIVAETVLDYPYPFITEKTYRAFASLRPFILLAPYQSLKFLQSVGFKTFSTIVDESYDNILCPEQRFEAVCETILKFVNRSINEVKKDLFKIQNDLIFNQSHLINLPSIELKKLIKQI